MTASAASAAAFLPGFASGESKLAKFAPKELHMYTNGLNFVVSDSVDNARAIFCERYWDCSVEELNEQELAELDGEIGKWLKLDKNQELEFYMENDEGVEEEFRNTIEGFITEYGEGYFAGPW